MKWVRSFFLCLFLGAAAAAGGCAQAEEDTAGPAITEGAVTDNTGEDGLTGQEENPSLPQDQTYAYETEDLFAERDGNQIYGQIYIPQNAGEKMPAMIVSLSYSQKALEVYPSAELQVIEGGGHGFYGKDAEEPMDFILAYLEEHVEKTAASRNSGQK